MRKIDNEINALKKIYNNYNSYLDLMKYFLPRLNQDISDFIDSLKEIKSLIHLEMIDNINLFYLDSKLNLLLFCSDKIIPVLLTDLEHIKKEITNKTDMFLQLLSEDNINFNDIIQKDYKVLKSFNFVIMSNEIKDYFELFLDDKIKSNKFESEVKTSLYCLQSLQNDWSAFLINFKDIILKERKEK